ncbi:MAG TPA: glycosyltransferase family 2 protein [Terriglobales bacterium]|nr:glycosyltransferase family 2 protein [Terriglobales bacterium]
MKFVFWASAAVIAYAYVGYPLLLWFRSWWSPRPVMHGVDAPRVSAVMVVRNEEANIAQKLNNLLTLDYPPEKLEVVVVSDGSTDGTAAALAEFGGHDSRLRTVMKAESRGKAAGLNDAIAAASGEVLLFTDARQQIEPQALGLLIENFADPAVGAASGELMLGHPASGETGKGMGLYWRIEKKIRELESASGSVAGATGAIYCARRELLEPLPEGTILDDVLLPMQVVRRGSRVIFDSRARAWDSPDLGSSREFARKVRTLSGNYQLLQIAPWLLGASNAIRFEFVSHKLMRLVVPFALVALLISALFLTGTLYRVALFAQIAFYALSLVALGGMKIGPLSRIADPARTFVVLNSAAMVAFVNFIVGRKAVWGR